MNYCGLNTCDTANGDGIRVSLFVSGCRLHCKGCFNPESWDFKAGEPFDEGVLIKLMAALNHDYVDGLSILGGDPLEPENIDVVTAICRLVKEDFPDKTIWLWTGRKIDKYFDHPIMQYLDVVVDGPFIESKKETDKTQHRGSTNQRVIYLRSYQP